MSRINTLHRMPRRLRKRYILTKAEIDFLVTATLRNYHAKTGHASVPRVSPTIDYIAAALDEIITYEVWDDLPPKSTKGTP